MRFVLGGLEYELDDYDWSGRSQNDTRPRPIYGTNTLEAISG